MTNVLLVIIIAIMLYQMYKRGELGEEKKKPKSFDEVLPLLKGKYCEVTWKKIFSGLDHLQSQGMSTKGTIVDFDDEWIVIEMKKKKKTIQEVIRKSYICDIKEIYEHH